MGGKRTGKGKYLYVCFAGVIFLVFVGCMGCTGVETRKERTGTVVVSAKPKEVVAKPAEEPVPAVKPPPEKMEKREKVEVREPPPPPPPPPLKALSQGDFESFIKENEKLLSLPGGKVSKEEALFNLGLAYAHPGNPKKDYGKSIGFFTRLQKEYPQGPLAEQAKIWVGVLQEIVRLTEIIEKSKQVDIEIEEKKREKAK